MKRGLLAALAIARKDLRTELRTKESLNASASFALVILVLFSFAFDLDREELYAISGGLLWLVYSFAGAMIVNRSFARDDPAALALVRAATGSSLTLITCDGVYDRVAHDYSERRIVKATLER